MTYSILASPIIVMCGILLFFACNKGEENPDPNHCTNYLIGKLIDSKFRPAGFIIPRHRIEYKNL
jgi:hypothetical protein